MIKIMGFLHFLWGLVCGLSLASGIWIFCSHGIAGSSPKIIGSLFSFGVYSTFPFSVASHEFSFLIFLWFVVPFSFLVSGAGLLFSQGWAKQLLLISISASFLIWTINMFSNNIPYKGLTIFPFIFYISTLYILYIKTKGVM